MSNEFRDPAVKITQDLYSQGAIDYTPVFEAEQFLGQQQNLLAQAQATLPSV